MNLGENSFMYFSTTLGVSLSGSTVIKIPCMPVFDSSFSKKKKKMKINQHDENAWIKDGSFNFTKLIYN